jgi:sugar phosphate isomerase/epimerase
MENKGINRRDFVGASLAAATGLWAAPPTALSGQVTGSPKSPGLKVGLYSITYLGIWYRGNALSLEDVIRRAKKYGYDGVEVDGKRPHGHPLSLTRSHARELRKLAEGEGIDIYDLAGNNDFSSPVTEHRDAQLVYMRDLIQLAPELGAKTVRVFVAWRGVTQKDGIASYSITEPLWDTVHKDFSPEQTWEWCREGLIQCARYAGDAGVTLALQNHKPVINDHKDMLRMVKEVGSPHLKVSLDAWIMDDKSEAGIIQAARDVGPLQALSHFGGEFKREPDGSAKGPDYYGYFVRGMKDIGYKGYIGYELCHTLPVVNGQTVGLEFADQCAEGAAIYMRNLIKMYAS